MQRVLYTYYLLKTSPHTTDIIRMSQYPAERAYFFGVFQTSEDKREASEEHLSLCATGEGAKTVFFRAFPRRACLAPRARFVFLLAIPI